METQAKADLYWQTKWPRTNGFYWFYGYQFKSERDQPKRLLFVRCRMVGPNRESPIYIAEGAFMYEEEGASGVWQRIPEPELPE